MDENARKRKREEEGESSEVEGIEREKPREGLSASQDKPKRLKKGERSAGADNAAKNALPDPQLAKAEKRKAKRERKKASAESRATKKESAKSQKEEMEALEEDKAVRGDEHDGEADADPTEELDEAVDLDEIDGAFADDKTSQTPPSPFSKEQSPTFDVPGNASGISSSTSSSLHPADPSSTEPEPSSLTSGPPQLTVEPKTNSASADPPGPTHEELRARLHARIAEMRLARKADHEDGTPVRTRQELLDQRRAKATRRQERKKKLRQQAKEEEQRQKAAALAQGSPLLSPSGEAPPPEPAPPSADDAEDDGAHFSFGRIAFDDGAALATPDLRGLLDPRPRKGRGDPRSALAAAQARAARLAGLDPAKRAAAEEHDAWASARRRAQGERVRDDPALLKKTVKRKEGQKRKSTREWTVRLEGVQKGKAARQAKRDANLKNKKTRGVNGKKEAKGKGNKKKGKKERPGFEGSFKTGGKRS